MADEPRMEDAPPWKPTGFAETRAARACSLIVFALLMLYTFLPLRILACGLPSFQRLFMEMDTGLPGLTRFFLSAGPVLWPLVLIAAIGSAVKEFAVKNRGLTLVVNGIHLVVIVALRELMVFALGAPLTRPMETIGGSWLCGVLLA